MILPLPPSQLRNFADGRVEVRLQAVLPLHVALEISALAGQYAAGGPALRAANDEDWPSSDPWRDAR